MLAPTPSTFVGWQRTPAILAAAAYAYAGIPRPGTPADTQLEAGEPEAEAAAVDRVAAVAAVDLAAAAGQAEVVAGAEARLPAATHTQDLSKLLT